MRFGLLKGKGDMVYHFNDRVIDVNVSMQDVDLDRLDTLIEEIERAKEELEKIDRIVGEYEVRCLEESFLKQEKAMELLDDMFTIPEYIAEDICDPCKEEKTKKKTKKKKNRK